MVSRRSLPVGLWLLLVLAALIAVQLQPTTGAGPHAGRTNAPGLSSPSSVPSPGVAVIPGPST
ncbi:MAG TPA: hypothetical protein VK656_04900, partial [Candidatus Acidoferrum sp.]|nr:hypothetical protein [Candidatus Acidoferrum sp.]